VRIGVTGHQTLPPPAVDLAMRHWTRAVPGGSELRAVSALAAGADQLFAEYALNAGGRLEAIEPCAGYARYFATKSARDRYEELLDAADAVITLPYPEPSKEAFLAAGLVLVERCEYLFALWDGEAARGLGGTADVVAYARTRGRAVKVLWPDGLARA
jgi:hypothetical protein